MAKRLVLSALQRVFADYIVELNEENLRLGVWNGRLELENLRINNAAVNALQLPVRVISGEVIKFKVYIPWLSLDRTPVRVEIDGVYLLMGTVRKEEWSSDEVRERKLAIKRSRVDAAMKKNIAVKESEDESHSKNQQKNEGYISRLIQRIIDNIEITVKNVHIRYEDPNLGAPEDRITSIGVTLAEFLLTTTDESFQVAFVDRTIQPKALNKKDKGASASSAAAFHQSLIHKLATIKGFGLYWRHSDSEKMSGMGSVEDMREALYVGVMNQGVDLPDAAGHGGFLLRPPHNILLKVIHDEEAGRIERPYYYANLDNAILDFDLRTEQLEQALALKDGITVLSNWSAFSSYRPNRGPQDDPRAWWRYAYICVTGRGSGHSETSKILSSRKSYIQCYKLKMRQESNHHHPSFASHKDSHSSVDEDEYTYDEAAKLLLDDLEYQLPVQAIVLFREMADSEMRAEDAAIRKRQQQQKGLSDEGKQKPDWMRWLFGDSRKEDGSLEEVDELDIETVAKNIVSECTIVEELTMDREREVVVPTSKTEVEKSLFHIELSSSGTLGLNGRGGNELVEVHLSSSLNVQVKYIKEIEFTFSIANFKVIDLYTQLPFFPCTVEPLSAVEEDNMDKNALLVLHKPVPGSTESSFTPLLSCQCHISSQGTDISIHALPLMVVYNWRLFAALSSAFHLSGRRELESVQQSLFTGLEEAKGRAAAYVAQTTYMRVSMDVQAPLIVIPSNTSASSTQSRSAPSRVLSSSNSSSATLQMAPNAILYVDCGKITLNGGAEARALNGCDEKDQKWKVAVTEVQVLMVRPYSGNRRLMVEPFRIEANVSISPPSSSSLSGNPTTNASISLLPKIRGVASPADVRAFHEILGQLNNSDEDEDVALGLQMLAPIVRSGVADMVETGESLDQVARKGAEGEEIDTSSSVLVTSDGDDAPPSHSTSLALSMSVGGTELVLLKPREDGDSSSMEEEEVEDKELFNVHLGKLHTDIKVCPRDVEIHIGFHGLVLREARGGKGASPLPGQQHSMRDMVCSTNSESNEDLISIHMIVVTDKKHLHPISSTDVDQPLSSDAHQYGIYANLRFRKLDLSLSSSSLDSFAPFFTALIGRDDGGEPEMIWDIEDAAAVDFNDTPELIKGTEEQQQHERRKSYNQQCRSSQRRYSFIGSSLAGEGYGGNVPSIIWQTALLAQKEMESKSFFVECHLESVSLEVLHNSTLSGGSWGEVGDPVICLSVSQLESEARISGSNTEMSFSLYEVRIVDVRPMATSNAFTIIFAPHAETEREATNLAEQPCSEPLVEASYTSSIVENKQDQNVKVQFRRFYCNLMTGPIKQGLRLAQETQEALWRMIGITGGSIGEGIGSSHRHGGGDGSVLLSIPTAASKLARLANKKTINTNMDAACKEHSLNVSFNLREAKFQLIEDPRDLRTRRLVLRLSAAGVFKRREDMVTRGRPFCDDDFKASISDLESFVARGAQNGGLEIMKQISEPFSANVGAVFMHDAGNLVLADMSLHLAELHTELSYMDILLVASAIKDVLEPDKRENDVVDHVTQTNGGGVMLTSMLGTRQKQVTMEELMVAGEVVELEEDLVEEDGSNNTSSSQQQQPEETGEQQSGVYAQKSLPTIRFSAGWSFARFVIVNDYEGLEVPVLSFCVSDVTLKGDGPVNELMLEGRMVFEAQFYNSKVALWEPVLEPWYPKLNLLVDSDWRINVEISDIHDDNADKQQQQNTTASESLLINVSEEMLESISSMYWMLFSDSAAASGSSGPGGQVEKGDNSCSCNAQQMRFQSAKYLLSLPNEGSSIARGDGGKRSMRTFSSANFTFWNHTGLEVIVSTVYGYPSFSDAPVNGLVLESGCSCNLRVDQRESSSQRDGGGGLSLWWKGHLAHSREPFQKLPINKRGKFLYSLVPLDPPPDGLVSAFPVVEETWEYSQFNNLSHRWVPPERSERPRWATRDCYTGTGGRGETKGEERRREDIKLPSNQWEWLDEWHPDKSRIEVGEIDEEGWEYAVGFSRFNVATKSRTKRDFDQARRRRWIRTRAPRPLPLEDPHRPLDLVFDVQVTPQGRLEVQALSTICIVNETRWPLEVSCLCSAWQDNSALLGTVTTHRTLYVPILLAYASHYQIRPAGLSSDKPAYSWCSPFAVYANGLNESLVVWATCACRSDDVASRTETPPQPSLVHLVVYIEREGDKVARIRVVPPLIVVNALPCELRFRAQHRHHIQVELQLDGEVWQPMEPQRPSSHTEQQQHQSTTTPYEVECGSIAPADSLGLYCVYMFAQAEIVFRVPYFQWSVEHVSCLPASLKDIRSKFHEMQVEFRLHDGAGGYLHILGRFERQFPHSSTCPAVKLTVFAELWLIDRTGLSIDFEIDGVKVAKPTTIEDDESKNQIIQDTSLLTQMPSIRNLWTESGTKYTTATVTSGTRIYVDRAYSFVSLTVPANLRGCILIQTANVDKNQVHSCPDKGWLQFRVTCPATVYLLFDSRAISIPQWILEAGFKRTRQDVIVRHSGRMHSVKCPFSVYVATIEEREGKMISLGGNKAAGASSMYVVIVGPLQKQYIYASEASTSDQSSPLFLAKEQQQQLGLEMENAWVSGRHGVFLSKRGDGLLKVGISEQVFVSEKRSNTNIEASTGTEDKTYWSKILHLLGAEGAGGILTLSDGMSDLEMTFRIERCPNLFSPSTKVTVLQRFALVNLLPVPLQLRQVREGCMTFEHDSASPDVQIPVGSWSAWRWKSIKGPRLVRLRVPTSSWSLGGIAIDVAGLTSVHLPSRSPEGEEHGGYGGFKHHVINVDVKLGRITDDFSLHIVIWGTSKSFVPRQSISRPLPLIRKQCLPMYRMVNMSNVCVVFWQVVDDIEREPIVLYKGRWMLKPGSATSFGWSYLDSPKQLHITVDGEPESVKLNTEGIGNMVQCPGEAKAFAQVLVQGGTKTILVTRVPPERLRWKDGHATLNPALMNGRDSTRSSNNCHKGEIGVVVPPPMRVSCILRGISFSLIGSQSADATELKQCATRHELVYAQISNVKMKVVWGLTGSVEVMAAGIQIDNHVDGRAYPVMLGKHPDVKDEYSSISGEGIKDPLFHFSLVSQLDERLSTRHYEYVAFRVLDLLAQADSASSVALLALAAPIVSYLDTTDRASERHQSSKVWLSGFTSEILHHMEDERTMNTSFGGGWLDFNRLLRETESQTRVFFRDIVLHPIVVTLSWAATPVPPCLMERTRGFATSLSAIPTVSHSRLGLSSYIAQDVFGFQEELGRNLLAFYMCQLNGQVMKLIGSFRALGSPADLVSGVGGGAKALLYAPIQGSILQPTEYVAGISSGAEMLARETVKGVFNTMAGLGGGALNLAANLAFDNVYKRRREARNIRGMVQKKGIRAGLASGGRSVVGGVTDGMSGVFTKPFETAKTEGVLGFFKGAGQGVLGAVVKPIVGVADGAVNVLQSVSNAAASSRNLSPLRLPRALVMEPETGHVVLEPFNADAGQAQALLKAVLRGVDFSGHAPMGGKVAIMSRTHLLLQNLQPSPFAPTTLLELHRAKTLSQAMESVRKAVTDSGLTATAHSRVILHWEGIAFVKIVDGNVLLCMYGDSDMRLDCSKREAAALYKLLAAHAFAMGDPTRVIPYDSVFGGETTKITATADRKGRDEDEKFTLLSPAADEEEGKEEEELGHHPKRSSSLSDTFAHSVMRAQSSAIQDSIKDYYRFASRKTPLPAGSQYTLRGVTEEELLTEVERQLKGVAVGLWHQLDMLMLSLVCSWDETHRRLRSCQCMCVAFINASRDSVQFHSIVKREGKAYRVS